MAQTDNEYTCWKRWQSTEFGRFTRDEALYFALETGLDKRSSAKVLEIGFGNGNFLGWVRSIKGDAFGVESDPTLTLRCKAFLGVEHTFSNLQDARLVQLRHFFTDIVAFDVIEHIAIAELQTMLVNLRKLLAENGRLIVRFPNGDSPFGRITQHGDPTHITTIGYQKLEYIAQSAGFCVSEIRAPSLPLWGVGPIAGCKRFSLKMTRRLVEGIIALLYYGGRRIPLDPNYVAVLRPSR
jgi:hypothetical protein